MLLARDRVGYQNLVKLTSIGYTEGFYYNPRMDRETLARHSEGLIVTSACMAGEVARHLTAGNDEQAYEVASWYANTFQDRYYLEVQGHDSEGQAELNTKVFALAEKLGPARCGHQRRPLPTTRPSPGPRHPGLHRDGEEPGRREPTHLRRGSLLQERRRDGGAFSQTGRTSSRTP